MTVVVLLSPRILAMRSMGSQTSSGIRALRVGVFGWFGTGPPSREVHCTQLGSASSPYEPFDPFRVGCVGRHTYLRQHGTGGPTSCF